MQRHLRGGLTTVASLTTVLVGLAAIDVRVRQSLVGLLNGRGPTGEIASAGASVDYVIHVVAQAIKDQSMERAPLVIFALAAIVLLLFMLRT
jgi:hypothetical protein